MKLMVLLAACSLALFSTQTKAQTVIEGPDADVMYTSLYKAGYEPVDVDGDPAVFVTDTEECTARDSAFSCATVNSAGARTHEFHGPEAKAFMEVLARAQVPSAPGPVRIYRISDIACATEPGAVTACQFDVKP